MPRRSGKAPRWRQSMSPTRPAIPPESQAGRRVMNCVTQHLRLVRGGVRREAVPNLQIIDPLVNRESSAAVKIRHVDAVDGGVNLVRPQMIEDRLAVDGHPDATVGSSAAVPEDLEFHPI